MATADDVAALAATGYLNDSGRVIWTTVVLLPAIKLAVLDLEQALKENEISYERDTSARIEVDAGDVSISTLPTDFVEPIRVWERNRDSSEDWVDIGPQSEKIDPNYLTGTQITQWVWETGVIKINPPTQDREVLLDYRAALTPIEDENSPLDITSSLSYLAARTAELAADMIGHNPSKANVIGQKYTIPARDTLINTLLKNGQGNGVRRIAYKGRFRRVVV